MSEAVDNRFIRVVQDPRFKKIPREERRLKIDTRFEKMFTDKSFHTKFTRDKRGKRLDGNQVEDLNKFYELKNSKDDDVEDGGDRDEVEYKDNFDYEDKGNDQEANGDKNLNLQEEDRQPTSPKHPGKEVGSTLRRSKQKKKRKGKLLANVSGRNTILCSAKKNNKKKTPINSNKDVSSKGDAKSSSSTAATSKSIINFQDIRGETLPDGYESSSTDESSDMDNFDDENQIIHGWGDLEDNVKCIENAETSRIAVCNCDWDRIGADDLYMLFTSFKPPAGEIISVKVYVSEFGKQRMEEEKISGPKELNKSAVTVTATTAQEDDGVEETEDDMKEEGSGYDMEKLREYQMNRLKYYYAVVECNNVDTANKLYEELDGQEYEMSATRLDLRFIPDNITFDEEPSSIASAATIMANNYEPAMFHNTALQQSTVRLTWDETDPKRVQATMRKFDKNEIDQMDFNEYLASASSDEEDMCNGDLGKGKIEAYRQLLQGIDSKVENDEGEGMHLSFIQKKDNTDKNQISTFTTLKNSSCYKDETDESEREGESEKETAEEGDDDDDDDYLRESENVGGEEVAGATNNVESGFDDPFFHETADVPAKLSMRSKKIKKGKKKSPSFDDNENLTEEERKKKKELELLILDEKDDKKHFHLKEILQCEKNRKTKRKRKKMKSVDDKVEDDFDLDVADPRFGALYSSHLYSIDPSDPNFKRTKATQAIIDESQKRRKLDANIPEVEVAKQGHLDPKLSEMINSVKSKTALHTFKKEKNKEKVKKYMEYFFLSMEM